MKFVYTLCFCLFSSASIGQAFTEKIEVRTHCTKRRIPDTLSKKREAGIQQAPHGQNGGGLQVRVVPAAKISKEGAGNIRLRCHSEYTGPDPLLVIEGKMVPNINDIGTENIEDVTVLQAPQAQALFGVQGRNGAILITLKKKYEKIVIKDLADKNPIPKATVSFVFPERKDTLRYIANDSGVVVSNSLEKLDGCQMIVSSAGYKDQVSSFRYDTQNLQQDIFLERNIKACGEVIIVCYDCTRTIRCGSARVSAIRLSNAKNENNGALAKLVFFPNPAKTGQNITLKKEFDIEGIVQVKVFDAGGKLVGIQQIKVTKGINRLSITADYRWTPGTYFLQVHYANGGIAASGRIILQ